MQPARVHIHESADISAPADDVWELISDWAGMLRWWLHAGDGGLQGPALIGCTLVGEPNAVPRKRVMELDSGAVAEEEIFYQNDETRRINYTKADDRYIRSYVACTYVDEVDPATCTVHVLSSFDALAPLSPASARARFSAVYEAMFHGYQAYFAATSPTP
jgi:hypothetical protein